MRFKNLRWMGLSLAMMLSLNSCATVMSGPTQKFTIDSTPPGANVTVVNNEGDQVLTGTTPIKTKLNRGAGYFRAARYVATFEKEGYEKEKVTIVQNGVGNWWTMGNLLIGGLVGILIVDPISGAMYVLEADEINQVMTPVKN